MESLCMIPNYRQQNIGKLSKSSKVQHVWTAKIKGFDFELKLSVSKKSGRHCLILNRGTMFDSKKGTESIFFRNFYFHDVQLMLTRQGGNSDSFSIDLTIDGQSFREIVARSKVKTVPTNKEPPAVPSPLSEVEPEPPTMKKSQTEATLRPLSERASLPVPKSNLLIELEQPTVQTNLGTVDPFAQWQTNTLDFDKTRRQQAILNQINTPRASNPYSLQNQFYSNRR